MNLIQLKYFQAICSYHTVSAAAEYLHISQPSLSNAIKELEREFGITLFKRHHRGMQLTPEGETLLKLSEDLLSRSDHIETIMGKLGKKRNFLKLGVPPMLGSLILPKIYSTFLSDNPDIELEITEGGRKDLTKKLSEDFLDMVFLSHNRPIEATFSAQLISRLEIVCCVSKNNPLSNHKTLNASQLAEIPLVLFKNSFFQTEEIKRWFAISNIKPNILLQTEQLSTIQTLISNNIATGFMFRQLIDAESDFVPIPLNTPIHADISLVWKKDAYLFNAMKQLSEHISQTDMFA